MPGVAHEVLVAVLREHPDWLMALLETVGHGTLPPGLVAVDSAVRFTPPAEVRADLVLAQGEQGPWVVVEVQLRPDEEKQRNWLLLSAVLLDARGTMGDLLVLTTRPRVARWAARVARGTGPLGTRLGLSPRVLLLTAERAELLLDPARPELAFFAAWAQHEREGLAARRIVRRALDLTGALPPELRSAQIRAILNVLSERMLAFLREATMGAQTFPESPAYRAWREELEARGRAEGEARALFAILAARGIALDEPTRARVLACTDLAQLDAWIRRASVATSLAEVFPAD